MAARLAMTADNGPRETGMAIHFGGFGGLGVAPPLDHTPPVRHSDIIPDSIPSYFSLISSLFVVAKPPGEMPSFCATWLSMAVPKPVCFKPGCLQLLHRNALLRPFVLFCALLWTCVYALALICALLRLFVCFCERPRLERPRLGTAELSMQVLPFSGRSQLALAWARIRQC